jgi:hypothetical protein
MYKSIPRQIPIPDWIDERRNLDIIHGLARTRESAINKTWSKETP